MGKRILRMVIAGLIALVLLAGLPGFTLGQETPVTATPLPTITLMPATATSMPTATATEVPAVAITAVPEVTATGVPLELPVTGQSNTTRALIGLVPVAVLLLLALPAVGRWRARRR